MATQNPITYRVTRQIVCGSSENGSVPKRIQRGTQPEAELRAKGVKSFFETDTVLAKGVADAIKVANARWRGQRIVSVEEVSSFDKRAYSHETLAEVFERCAAAGYVAPTPEDYADYTTEDRAATPDLVREVVSGLRDGDVVPGLEAIFDYDEHGNPDWVIFCVEDHYSKKVPYRGQSTMLHDLGDPDDSGWEAALGVAQDILDLVAPLT